MFHVRMRERLIGVTSTSSAAVRPGTGRRWRSGRRLGLAELTHWKRRRVLAVDRESASPPPRPDRAPMRAGRLRRGFPCSRARASRPSSSADIVGGKPAKPSMVFRNEHRAAPRRAARSDRRPPARAVAKRVDRRRARLAARTRRAPGCQRSPRLPDCPIEPVAPSSAIRVMTGVCRAGLETPWPMRPGRE